ncbi:hypothetical protein ACFU7Y_37240 [Kitasatospora sp. NPDC057542]|uniref:hypothetical protein n=1 Tax=Kitasatospora sp. NPDC057542 TaxID=3346162 RepID=UPI003690F0E8
MDFLELGGGEASPAHTETVPARVATAPRPAPAEPAAAPAPVPAVPTAFGGQQDQAVVELDRTPGGDLVAAQPVPCVRCGWPAPYRSGGRPIHMGGWCTPAPADAPQVAVTQPVEQAPAGTGASVASVAVPRQAAPSLRRAVRCRAWRRRHGRDLYRAVWEAIASHFGQHAYRAMLRSAGLDLKEPDSRDTARELPDHGVVLAGTPAAVADALTDYRNAGVDEIVLDTCGVLLSDGPRAAPRDIVEIAEECRVLMPPLEQEARTGSPT